MIKAIVELLIGNASSKDGVLRALGGSPVLYPFLRRCISQSNREFAALLDAIAC